MKQSCLISIFLILAVGCQNPDASKLEKLYNKEQIIWCSLAKLQDSIKMQWDEVNDLLEKNISHEVPKEEKANMLKVRNASLLRMFEAYNTLNDSIQHKIVDTENYDTKVSQRVVQLRKQLTQISEEKYLLTTTLTRNGENSDLIQYLEEKFAKENACL